MPTDKVFQVCIDQTICIAIKQTKNAQIFKIVIFFFFRFHFNEEKMLTVKHYLEKMIGPELTGKVRIGPQLTRKVRIGPVLTGKVRIGPVLTGKVRIGPER